MVYDTKNIEDIQVGDMVYSYDTDTGEYEYKEVTEKYARKTHNLNLLTIEDENGNAQTIETTDSHPFWVVTDEPDPNRAARDYVAEDGMTFYHENLGVTENGYWVEAKDLRVGDVFLGADGKLSTLTGAVRVEQTGGIDVFNFTVEGNHDYFILEKDYDYGQTCILVHNAGGVYALVDDAGNVVRTGRTNDLARRAAEHAKSPTLGKYKSKTLYETDVYAEQRGLEQIAHEMYQPPLNKIKQISDFNIKKAEYMKAAMEFLLK